MKRISFVAFIFFCENDFLNFEKSLFCDSLNEGFD